MVYAYTTFKHTYTPYTPAYTAYTTYTKACLVKFCTQNTHILEKRSYTPYTARVGRVK